MLILTRTAGEKVIITVAGIEVEVMISEIGRGRVRLGFLAPPEVKVWREEIHRLIQAEKKAPQKTKES